MVDDPYPVYRELRQEHPVYHNAGRDFWALSRFADVQDAARGWSRLSSAGGVDIDVAADFFGAGDFNSSQPPKHERLRNVVKEAFSASRLKQLERTIDAQVDELLEPLIEAGRGEFVEQIAARLPLGVIFGMLGFPRSEGEQLLPLMTEILVRTPGSSEVPQDALRARAGLEEYILDLARQRRRAPKDDLLSAIVAAERTGALLQDELTGMCLLLLLAGWETTSVLTTNAMWLLAAHPDQRDALSQRPDRIPAAIEEILRFESPAQQHMRIATCDVELHGETIPAGERVVLLWAAANRDETRWPDGEVFDVERAPQRNLAFGEGIHHCLGAPLARLECRILLERVLRSNPSFDVDEPQRFPGVVIRGISHLPISWDRC